MVRNEFHFFYFFDFWFSFQDTNIVLFRPNRLIRYRTSYYYGLIGIILFRTVYYFDVEYDCCGARAVQEPHHFPCWSQGQTQGRIQM
jgi:hypothetical protein